MTTDADNVDERPPETGGDDPPEDPPSGDGSAETEGVTPVPAETTPFELEGSSCPQCGAPMPAADAECVRCAEATPTAVDEAEAEAEPADAPADGAEALDEVVPLVRPRAGDPWLALALAGGAARQ